MKTILCAVDFSRNSRDAFLYALELARIFNARLLVLHCYETPVIFTELPSGAIPVNVKELQDNAQLQLKKFISSIRLPATDARRVEMIVQQGLPSARIVEIALEKKVDLIVLGSTGTSGLTRWLTGSNALRVLRQAPCTVLIIPRNARFSPWKKIVYATDLQDDNLHAARSLLPMARKFDSEILFLNIDNRLLMDEKDYEKMKRKITTVVRYPKLSGYVSTQLNVVKGIGEFVKKVRPTCLAVYSRHHGFFSRLTGGSVTASAALKIRLPLLALPEKE